MSRERTTGMGLWTDAKEMLEAAKILEQNGSSVFGPKYYLLGHAFEVGVKSFILSKGASLKCLKDIGHDLVKAIDWATPCGIGDYFLFTDEHLAMVKLLNPYYKAKEFEYRVTGFKSYPNSCDFALMLDEMLVAIKPVCVASVSSHAIQGG